MPSLVECEDLKYPFLKAHYNSAFLTNNSFDGITRINLFSEQLEYSDYPHAVYERVEQYFQRIGETALELRQTAQQNNHDSIPAILTDWQIDSGKYGFQEQLLLWTMNQKDREEFYGFEAYHVTSLYAYLQMLQGDRLQSADNVIKEEKITHRQTMLEFALDFLHYYGIDTSMSENFVWAYSQYGLPAMDEQFKYEKLTGKFATQSIEIIRRWLDLQKADYPFDLSPEDEVTAFARIFNIFTQIRGNFLYQLVEAMKKDKEKNPHDFFSKYGQKYNHYLNRLPVQPILGIDIQTALETPIVISIDRKSCDKRLKSGLAPFPLGIRGSSLIPLVDVRLEDVDGVFMLPKDLHQIITTSQIPAETQKIFQPYMPTSPVKTPLQACMTGNYPIPKGSQAIPWFQYQELLTKNLFRLTDSPTPGYAHKKRSLIAPLSFLPCPNNWMSDLTTESYEMWQKFRRGELAITDYLGIPFLKEFFVNKNLIIPNIDTPYPQKLYTKEFYALLAEFFTDYLKDFGDNHPLQINGVFSSPI